tara:strand:+ start:726 stop:1304 length:579 start_codon:yes stop_codon:yes gene_type:complete
MYEAKDFIHLIGMDGLSEEQLTIHFGLYNGYVNNVNTVLETMKNMSDAKEFGPAFAEIKRRFGWEFGGMRLHEQYFENMTKSASPLNPESALAKKITEDFGSFDAWKTEFIKTASLRGVGWTILVHDTHANRLINTWVNEHDVGHLVTTTPIVVLDVWEHAFVFDFKMKRPDYIDVFMNSIDWAVAEKRFGA